MFSADRAWSSAALGLLVVVALLPRLAAVGYNAWPHGDVLLDAAIADSLAERGELIVPLVDVRFYPIGRFGFGYPPDQHPPLWPLLGAGARLAWPDSYEALKLVSLVAGLLLIPAVYRCGRDMFGAGPGLLAASLCAVSYLLIDFSGNGSLWSLLALLYVLFVWRAACFSSSDRGNLAVIGLLMGGAYLTNYPAIVLPISHAALLLVRRLRSSVDPRVDPAPDPRPTLALLPFGVALVVTLPWLLYSLMTFGNPVWSQPLERQLGGGDKQVEVVFRDGELVKRNLPSSSPVSERVRSTLQNLYGNVGFLVRQSFVLAPFLGGFALAGAVALALAAARGGAQRELPLLLLTLTHGALILLWPTTKFRYLVPLFPLAALLGSWLLWQLKPPELRNLLAATAFGLTCFTSAWTWASIPSHTYYYDGGPVDDNFGGQGEIEYIRELRELERAAASLGDGQPGAVLGPHPLYAMTERRLVVTPPALSPEVVEHLVGRYAIRYVVAEPDRLSFYSAFLPGRVRAQEERYVVYELER